MHIVSLHPKKTSWRIGLLIYPDGHAELTSGLYPATIASAIAEGARREESSNVIVRLRMRANDVWHGRSSVNLSFEDADGGGIFYTTPDGAVAMFRAIADGRLRAEDGWISGLFTFRKQGAAMHLWPLEAADRPGEAPADAPDLSDLVAALGPAKVR